MCNSMRTVSEILKHAKASLERTSDTPNIDSELLLCHLLKIDRFDLLLDQSRVLSNDQIISFENLLQQRVNRKPIAYIINEKWFFDDCFYVDERVLTPRPETEILVEKAIEFLKKEKKGYFNILDICTGSGCIGITLKKYFNGSLTMSDISKDALFVAKRNAENIIPNENYTVVHSDLFSSISGEFDIITSNPPYLSKFDMDAIINTPVNFEPELALYGGESGFEVPKKIIDSASDYLCSGGFLFMELGYEGANYVKKLKSDLTLIDIIKDYNGIERVAIWAR